MELATKTANENFIQANTKVVLPEFLREETIIPAFAKDNESTISHMEFVETVQSAVEMVFQGELISEPTVRVSHPIRGRIPEAKGKPAKHLLEHEKTLYYERMTFMIELPEIKGKIGKEDLSLSIGGVRAYNQENLYSRKGPERFKVFIGFKNWVCTNLCVSTDGFLGDLKVMSIAELFERSSELLNSFELEEGLSSLQKLEEWHLGPHQFSHLVGRAKQYLNMPLDKRKNIEAFPLGDTQLSSLVKDYYTVYDGDELTSLWELYNLMTSANKSSYIDSYLERSVASLKLCQSLGKSLKSGEEHWYLH